VRGQRRVSDFFVKQNFMGQPMDESARNLFFYFKSKCRKKFNEF